jgi:bifunctional enzyme CysN/CysC
MARILFDEFAGNIAEYLHQQENKSLLRFLTCGSVDDGKSTLIGRLLYDTKALFEDQLAVFHQDNKKHGTAGDNIDFALLLDGLEAEREQGITIDVAYRFFATAKRRFIVADTPGHEEYTRNMATGASTADLAIVLVDARQGILAQTRRHSFIVSMLGIGHVVLAINKIDLIDFDEAIFEQIAEDYLLFSKDLGFTSVQAIPLSARFGDNVITKSENTPWYSGPSLLEYLETVAVSNDYAAMPFRLPVQYVSRPSSGFRGFAGQIAAGRIAVDDQIAVAKSGQVSAVKSILSVDGTVSSAREGQAVTIVLKDEIDASRGNMLVSLSDRPTVADQFQAHLIWFDADAMIPGRSYILRTETESVAANITALKYTIDVNNLAHTAAKSLRTNEFGVCNISVQSPIVFDPYRINRSTGNFILMDRFTNATVGAGMIDYALRRADNIHWQALEVSKRSRSTLMGQQPAVLWFTGLSGSGKSTVANALEKLLHGSGHHTILLDGDNVRHGLNRDLGFTDADRVENIRRIAEVAKLMTDAGLIVIVSFISPFRSERRVARDLMEKGEFVEVFVDTPLEECIRRDPKGLYKRAISGEIRNFTGIDSPYEAPENAELHLKTVNAEPAELAMQIRDHLLNRQNLGGQDA